MWGIGELLSLGREAVSREPRGRCLLFNLTAVGVVDD